MHPFAWLTNLGHATEQAMLRFQRPRTTAECATVLANVSTQAGVRQDSLSVTFGTGTNHASPFEATSQCGIVLVCEVRDQRIQKKKDSVWRALGVKCATITTPTDIFPQCEKQISRCYLPRTSRLSVVVFLFLSIIRGTPA